MNITSLIFMFFLAAGLLVYYLIPDRFQWECLLGLSLIFLCAADWRNLLFLGYVTLVSWSFGLSVEKLLSEEGLSEDREIRKKQKAARAKKAKRRAVLAVILLILVLALAKYVPAALGLSVSKVNEALSSRWRFLKLITPFGLSYYLLMSVSYVLDVYWQRDRAEHSFFRLLLFLCWFPQLTQGPIGRYSRLREQFFGPSEAPAPASHIGETEDGGAEVSRRSTSDHGSAWDNLKAGVPLILWGFFKKMVIADRIAVFVGRASSGRQYGLNVLVCLVFYGIELYCDFSGGIDAVRGMSECFGIRLAENFRQPYFSRDLGEFWRRWHISLGAFMKDYVFFPLALWKPLKLFKRRLKKHMTGKMASKVIVAVNDLIVFLIVGIWHGAGSRYVGWGIYNGAILAFSAVMEDTYAAWKRKLGIEEKSKGWQIFRLVRTLIIVTAGWVFDCASTAPEAIRMFFRLFVMQKSRLTRIFNDPVETWFYLPVLAAACLILLWVDIRHEKGISIREKVGKKSFRMQTAVWTFLFQAILLFGRTIGAGGFMYANF